MKVIKLKDNVAADTSLLSGVKQDLRDATLKPKETSRLNAMPSGEPWELIKALYASKEPSERILASLLNAVFTAKKDVFLFSKRIMGEILAADKNIKRNSIDSNALKICQGFIGPFFSEVRPSSKSINGKLCAAVWLLTHKELSEQMKTYTGKSDAKLAEQISYATHEHSKRSHVTVSGSVAVIATGTDSGAELVDGSVDEVELATKKELEPMSDVEKSVQAKAIVDLRMKLNASLALDLFPLPVDQEITDISEAAGALEHGSNNNFTRLDSSGNDPSGISVSRTDKSPGIVPPDSFVIALAAGFDHDDPMGCLFTPYHNGIRLTVSQWKLFKIHARDTVGEHVFNSNEAHSYFAEAWLRIDRKDLESRIPDDIDLILVDRCIKHVLHAASTPTLPKLRDDDYDDHDN